MNPLLLTGLVLGTFAAFAQSPAQTSTNNPPPLFSPLSPAPPAPSAAPPASLSAPPAPSATRPASLSAPPAPSATRPAPSGYVPDDKYKLRPGDKVSLQIIEDREPAKSLLVADSGELDVPYIGRVAVAGKTCKQAADQLKAGLEKEFYYRATVVLALDSANKLWGRIYVWGQVRNQGPIDVLLNENITAGKAILRAGGFADFANKKRVKIVRAATQPNATATAKPSLEVNMADVLEEGRADKDVPLEPDDSVIVPSRLINF